MEFNSKMTFVSQKFTLQYIYWEATNIYLILQEIPGITFQLICVGLPVKIN